MHFPKTTNKLELAPVQRGYSVEYTVPTPSDTPLIHYWDALLAHKGVIVLSILFCVGIAALVTYSMSPVYQAKGVLELQTPPQLSYAREGAPDVNGQTFDSYVETQ